MWERHHFALNQIIGIVDQVIVHYYLKHQEVQLWRIQILGSHCRWLHKDEEESFRQKESELTNKVIPFLKPIHKEAKGIVQSIQCGNAGDNIKILEENFMKKQD